MTLTPVGKRSRDDLSFCIVVEDAANNKRSEMIIKPSDSIDDVKNVLEVEFVPLNTINRTFELKLGEIIRFIDGPIAPVDCVSVSSPKECEYPGHCPFFGFWGRVRQAISDVVDQTTFADLIKENASLGLVYIPEWTI